MAITITIGDGTDTVTLTATDAVLLSYVQESPAADALSVNETLEVEFIGGNAAVDASIKKLQLLFEEARNRAGGNVATPKVWMTVTIDSDVWRSPVYDGRVVSPNESWLKYERALGSRAATVLVNRAAWWEDNTERQISLTNGNGTDNTAGLNVYYNNSGTGSSPNKQHNYVEITAAKVAGDLPAPVRVEMTFGGAGTTRPMIGVNVFSDPANLVYFYEGETGTSDTSDATCSGGKYHEFSCTGRTGIPKTITSQADELRGGYYRILGRVASTGTWYFEAYAKDVNESTGPRITRTLSGATTFKIIDFGVIRIPAYYLSGMAFSALEFGIVAEPDSGTRTLNVDYLQITPLDAWKEVDMGDTYATVKLDSMEEIDYGLSGSSIVGFGQALGGLLKVWPGRLQRFIFQVGHPTDVVTLYSAVKIFYRPRRRIL